MSSQINIFGKSYVCFNNRTCTVTAWENRDLMLNFMRNGTHLTAMKSFHKIATGKTFGFEADKIPSWSEAFELLETKGITY